VRVSERLTALRSVALITLAAVFAFGAIKLVRPLRQTFTSAGDVAYIELGVRRAVRLQEELGVYSRFGWHHPGPALLYALAPVYWLSGGSSRALFLGAWLVNGAAAIAAVVVVRARAGELAARLMTATVLIFLLAGRFTHFIDPWNVKILAVPMLCLLVACAGAASGSVWSYIVALVAGTYLVQAHVGTVPIVAVFLASSGAVLLVTTRREGWAGVWPWPVLVGSLLLTVMWLPPVVQQVTATHRGNISQLVDFSRHPPAGEVTHHPFAQAVTVVANRATLVPLRTDRSNSGDGARQMTLAAISVLGLAIGVAGWRRWRFIALLAFTTPVGVVLALLSAMRVVGTLYPYLFYWTEALTLPALFAAAWVVARLLSRLAPRVVDAAVLVLVVALAVVWVRAAAHAGTTSFGDSPAARDVAHRIEGIVGQKDAVFSISGSSPQIGAVFLTLEKDGYHFRVQPEAPQLYSGNTSRPVRGPVFVVAAAPQPPLRGVKTLMTERGIVLLERL
jgi:hypothetical protein